MNEPTMSQAAMTEYLLAMTRVCLAAESFIRESNVVRAAGQVQITGLTTDYLILEDALTKFRTTELGTVRA